MKEKIFKFTMLVLILVFLFVVIRNTYAKYITSKDSGAQARIAQWHITLNDSDITENMDFSELIQIVYDENENIAQNIIAPTSSGYFIVNLESTGTEVPFTYEFSLDLSESYVSDYRITSYLPFDGSEYTGELTDEDIADLRGRTDDFVELESSTATITGIVEPPVDLSGNYTGEKVINSFLIYFGWYDGEDENLDNKNDVIASKTANNSTPKGTGVITLNLSVAQIEE